MTAAVIVLGVALVICVFLIVALNRSGERTDRLMIDAVNERREFGNASERTWALMTIHVKRISE